MYYGNTFRSPQRRGALGQQAVATEHHRGRRADRGVDPAALLLRLPLVEYIYIVQNIYLYLDDIYLYHIIYPLPINYKHSCFLTSFTLRTLYMTYYRTYPLKNSFHLFHRVNLIAICRPSRAPVGWRCPVGAPRPACHRANKSLATPGPRPLGCRSPPAASGPGTSSPKSLMSLLRP